MTIVWNLIKAFLVGGALCMIGEILLLKTKLTPARILVGNIFLHHRDHDHMSMPVLVFQVSNLQHVLLHLHDTMDDMCR